MKRSVIMLLSALFSGAALATPVNPKDIAADALWVAHADFQAFKGGEMGQYMMGKLDKAGIKEKLAAFQQMFQFDPCRDIDSVTAYGSSREEKDGVMLVRGSFKGDALVTLLKAADDYTVTEDGGVTVHGWTDKKHGRGKRAFGAILDDKVVVMGQSSELVARAATLLKGEGASLDPHKAGLDLPDGAPSFFLAAANLGDLGVRNPRAAMLKDIVRASVVCGEHGGNMHGELRLTLRTPEAAAQMGTMLNGLLALAQMNAKDNPDLARMASSIKGGAEGDQFAVTMAVPVKDLIARMEEMEAKIKVKCEGDKL